MADYYITGSVQLTNGSKAVVGIDTAWAIAQVAGGTIYVQAAGNPLPLVSIESDTAATAALEWTGATGTYPYALLRATAFSEQLETNSNILSRLLVAMEAGTLYRYDVAGAAADLGTYGERPKGFAFLATDVNPADLYIKASATSGDWAGPFSYGTGPAGPAPAIGFEPVITGAPGTNAGMALTGSGDPGDPFEVTFTIPAGEIGVNPRGAYSGATAYAARDMVTDNGSSWLALQATMGNAPPILPVTVNNYWELVAAKGIDGTGTGDVVGPAGANVGRVPVFSSNTGKVIGDGGKLASDLVTGPAVAVDGALVAYDGATGKVLKGLTSAEAKSWLATTALDVLFNNATVNLPGSPATVQAAIESLAANSGGKNDALLALEIADLKGSRLGMVGGIADAFDDLSGVAVNTGGLDSNALLLLHGDGPDASTAVVDSSSFARPVTVVGNAQIDTAQSKFGGASILLDGAGDYLTVPDSPDWAFGSGDFTIDFWVRLNSLSAPRLASHATSLVTGWRFYVDSGNLKFQVYSDDSAIVQVTGASGMVVNTWYHLALVKSGNNYTIYRDGAQIGTVATANVVGDYPSPLNIGRDAMADVVMNGWLDEVRISNVARWTAPFVPPTAAYSVIAGVSQNYVYDQAADLFRPTSSGGVFDNMTLVSVPVVATSQPSSGRFAVQTVESATIAINVDLVAEMSRDDGATWSAGTLSLLSSLNGSKIYEASGINLAAQPAGTAMKWRIRTLNNKNVAISGVVMQWS